MSASDLLGYVRKLTGPRRQTISEPEVTDVLAWFAELDELFRRDFVVRMIGAAERGSFTSRAVEFGRMNGSLLVDRQRHTGKRDGERGRCDLWFDQVHPPKTLAVEVKLGADYEPRQREKYLAELAGKTGPGALLALTARKHASAPPVVADDPRWLGEISWGDLYAHGLADLEFDPKHAALQGGWRRFLQCLVDDEHLGFSHLPGGTE